MQKTNYQMRIAAIAAIATAMLMIPLLATTLTVYANLPGQDNCEENPNCSEHRGQVAHCSIQQAENVPAFSPSGVPGHDASDRAHEFPPGQVGCSNVPR